MRGYVEIFLASLSPARNAALLLTPEHRGTFFKDLTATDPQLDQIIYPLPTATGNSLYRLQSLPFSCQGLPVIPQALPGLIEAL